MNAVGAGRLVQRVQAAFAKRRRREPLGGGRLAEGGEQRAGEVERAELVEAGDQPGQPADRDLLSISFGDIRVAHKGMRDPDYSEKATSDYMRGEDIKIVADIGLGKGSATVWTCDLTKEYVEINGDYRS